MQEGISRVGLHYDIVCHYLVNFWGQMSQLQSPLQPITCESFESFVAAIPKFHLAGHTDNCYARFSLNFLTGVGRLDGEGGERCWSNLNHAAGSTCEKGPGSRVDSLNQVMQQWNWSRTVRLGRELLKRLLCH
jgi:hypothetical protein